MMHFVLKVFDKMLNAFVPLKLLVDRKNKAHNRE